LTNQQLASLMNLSEPQIKNLLAEIEKAHALLRRSIAGRRTLQLLEPENFAAVASQWIYRLTNYPVIDLPDNQLAGNWEEEEDISIDPKTLKTKSPPPPKALLEGGPGGDLPASQLAGNQLAGNQLAGNQLAGNQLAGNQLAGNQLAGNQLAGNQLAGNQLAGNQLAGNQLAGNQLAGNQLAGNQLAGNQLAGNQLAGNQLAGNQLAGNQLAGNQLAGNQLAGNQLAGNQMAGKSDTNLQAQIAQALRDAGVYLKPASKIASVMWEHGIASSEEAVGILHTELHAEMSGEDIDAKTAMRRVVARLKRGEWGMAETREATAQAARLQAYAAHNQSDTVETTEEIREASPYERFIEAELLWKATLDELELQMARATFDTWLRNSQGLGYNGDGQTLVVQVKNDFAIEWLEGKLAPVITRTLQHLAGKEVSIRFVPERKANYAHAPTA